MSNEESVGPKDGADAGFQRFREHAFISKTPPGSHAPTVKDTGWFTVNSNLLLARISDIENRLLALEKRVNVMERGNRL